MSDLTRKYITTLVFVLGLGGWQGVFAQASKSPLTLKPDAPDRYMVVPGYTLWSIAGRYTDSPWRWNELWNVNKDDIKNPHRIYPGNVIGNTVQLSPRGRAESTSKTAIPSIPPAVIEPFLSRPLVVEALVDPESKSMLGYEAIYLGTAKTVVVGDQATIELTSPTQEVSAGDRLVAAGKAEPVTNAPRAPNGKISGHVIGVYGGVGQVGETGRHGIIKLTVGKAQGLELGQVLALHRLGATVPDASTKVHGAAPAKLPDERYGLGFVFRVLERVSYALVMDVARPVNPLDVVQNP
ncbi:MAG: LysM domain-containing protein [Proteobacteria bacterium]|nr:LysM domain-containing protein [Pseudomonadota bacterium]